MGECQDSQIVLGLTSVIVAVKEFEPRVLVIGKGAPGLPFGAFRPDAHRTLELSLRSWVDDQTGMTLGYVEQLYTFGNRHRDMGQKETGTRVITVGYLALVGQDSEARDGEWRSWYQFLPWEDHRKGRPEILDELILPALFQWSDQVSGPLRDDRLERIAVAFGTDLIVWDPERVIWRYELLYEAGLIWEAHRDWASYSGQEADRIPINQKNMDDPEFKLLASRLGQPMDQDHRRILASSVGRLRGKLKYRPLVFELVPAEFTLFHVQKVVEALSGVALHKQNFRRLLIQGGLVKETGHKDTSLKGRPAALFRFRRSVLVERRAPGVGLPSLKS